jgi:hypothetical protein
VAGAHPPFNVWNDFQGPLDSRHGRRLLGAPTLFLNGFTPAASLPAGLSQLALLQAGDERCWNLIDTDQVRPFPPHMFEEGAIRDGTSMADGTLEAVYFPQILLQAYYTSQAALRKAARTDLTYAQIFAEPKKYRGQVVHIDGKLRMLARLDPSDEAKANGVSDQYEAWILNEGAGQLFVFVFTQLPPSLRPYLGEAGKNKIKDNKLDVQVSGDGYFYKKFRYKALDSKANTARDAPVFIGHTLVDHTPPGGPAPEEADEWGNHLMAVFLGIVGFAVVVVVGMTWWFRRSDRQVRGRVLAARHTGLVLPPAEEDVPMAGPVEGAAATESGPGSNPEFGGGLGDFSGPAR